MKGDVVEEGVAAVHDTTQSATLKVAQHAAILIEVETAAVGSPGERRNGEHALEIDLRDRGGLHL
jgi:hypothetical protein